MKNRRNFLKLAAGIPLASKVMMERCSTSLQNSDRKSGRLGANWVMPDEGDPHLRTWMSFGPSKAIWGDELIDDVRENIARLAQTIAKFEQVFLLVRKKEQNLAKTFFTKTKNIRFIVCEMNDLWIRDYGATFVKGQGGKKGAVDFNFNGWGKKQVHQKDRKIAQLMARKTKSQVIKSRLCLEGGGIEVDGDGTAILTESCTLNKNRNPNRNRVDFEKELGRLLGIKKIIWLPGIEGADITDGHIDFYARFTSPGHVLVHVDQDPKSEDHKLTKQHLSILKNQTDASGRKLKVTILPPPEFVHPEYDSDGFCAGYINYYVCNGAVIAPEFGDKEADRKAKATLKKLYPGREIIMVNIDAIAAGGGGIHCVTQQEPK